MTAPRLVPPPSNPLAVAEQFAHDSHFDQGGRRLLTHWRGDFYAYAGDAWPEAELARLRADLYRWLGPAVYAKTRSDGQELVPFEPNRKKVADVLEALQSITHLGAACLA